MDHFSYKNHTLYAEAVAIKNIASVVGTPFYCYSKATLERHYHVFLEGFKGVDATICYAVKANDNLAILKTLGDLGAGGDCVSKGEIMRCLKAGIPGNKIVFSGVGKTHDELRYALEHNVMQINVESEPELLALHEVATSMGKKAPIAFRVNPDVDANTHHKIATGRKHDKFGIPYTEAHPLYRKAATLSGIQIQGVAVHIGSQLSNLSPFRKAFEKIALLVQSLRQEGHAIGRLDLGGGLGIPYHTDIPPLPGDYAKMVIETVGHLGCRLVFEPGRLLVGNAGILVASVIYLKRTKHTNFLIIDAAMNDLLRPTLYDAYHEIIPVDHIKPEVPTLLADVVGPICETGDVFGQNRRFSAFIKSNDLVALRSTGAYGSAMASTYNTRPLLEEVLVDKDHYATIRPRQTLESLLARDII